MVTFYNQFVKCGAQATVADVAGKNPTDKPRKMIPR